MDDVGHMGDIGDAGSLGQLNTRNGLKRTTKCIKKACFVAKSAK